jgi:hypothetical protein
MKGLMTAIDKMPQDQRADLAGRSLGLIRFANSDAIRPAIERTCSFGAGGKALR